MLLPIQSIYCLSTYQKVPILSLESAVFTQLVELFLLSVLGRHLEYLINKWASRTNRRNEASVAKVYLVLL